MYGSDNMMSLQLSSGGGPIVLDLEFGTTIVKKSKNGIDDDGVNDEEFDNGDYNYNVNFDSSFDSDNEDTDVDVDVDDMTDNIIDDGGDNVFHSSGVDALVEEEEENDSNIQTSAKSTHKSHSPPVS